MTASHLANQDYNPPRFKWTKRITLLSLVVVLVVVGLVTVATSVAQRRLDALVASYRAAGEPVYVEDFNKHKDIANDKNAAMYYQQAERAYVEPGGNFSKYDINDLQRAMVKGMYERFAPEVDQFIETNGATIALIQKGAQCDDVEWAHFYSRPLFNGMLSKLSAPRNHAKLLAIAAERTHLDRRDGEAVDLLILERRLSRDRSAGPACLMRHMVTLSVASLNCETIEHIAHELTVSTDAKSQSSDGASREQIQALMDVLLDETDSTSSLSRAIVTERAALIDAIDFLSKGKAVGWRVGAYPRGLTWFLKPLLFENSRESALYLSQQKSAAELDTYPQVVAKFPYDQGQFGGARAILPAYFLMPSFHRGITLDFKSRAQRRMAAIALAIRLFEVDRGRRPERLDELQPEYLAAIPHDPFAHGDNPIRYLPDAAPPLLYSVNVDGVDDGGAYKLRADGLVDWDELDLVFFLDGNRPWSRD